jgi:uncharacterized OsmC-like protein
VTSSSQLALPLVYKVDAGFWRTLVASPAACDAGTEAWRVYARSLSGMQKEAVVGLKPNGPAWRLASDEGPYLRGTDRAPFPLAFFASGVAFSLLSEVRRQAEHRNVALEALHIEQDTRYSMDGSFIRGDAMGGAMPVEVTLRVGTPASAEDLKGVVSRALRSSPAHQCMGQVLENRFSLALNGKRHELSSLAEAARSESLGPLPFANVVPTPDDEYASNVIFRTAAAESQVGVPGGVGSSLSAEQKRTLHVKTNGAWPTRGSLMTSSVQLLQPIGSTFQFSCDDGDDGRAPPPMAYLSTGVAFCYMTQMGRYAHIKRRELTSYEIVQESACAWTPRTGAACPARFDTHVWLASGISAADAEDLLNVSERTCFLHAGLRGQTPSSVQLFRGGEDLGRLDGAPPA